MVYIVFAAAVFITLIAATKVSKYADAISRLSGMGSLLIGTVLLAGATSLPEVTTSVTAVFLDNPDIAVGNVLGSNLFNLATLAVFDLIFRQRRILSNVHQQQRTTALFGVGVSIVAFVGLLTTFEFPFLHMGVDTILIFVIYVLSILVIRKQGQENEEEKKNTAEAFTLKQALIRFAIASVIILAAGTALTVSGDRIAVLTGLGSTFVGSFLIAASTSLPEVISVYIALKLNNENLAAASILGSNLFNMLILGLCDFLYEGSILNAASFNQVPSALFLLMNSGLLCYALFTRKRRRFYSLPSLLILIIYVGTMVYLYLT